MLSWIARLFGAGTTDAALRAEKALEEIAALVERARDDLRQRLGYGEPAPQLETEPEPNGNGKRPRRVRVE